MGTLRTSPCGHSSREHRSVQISEYAVEEPLASAHTLREASEQVIDQMQNERDPPSDNISSSPVAPSSKKRRTRMKTPIVDDEVRRCSRFKKEAHQELVQLDNEAKRKKRAERKSVSFTSVKNLKTAIVWRSLEDVMEDEVIDPILKLLWCNWDPHSVAYLLRSYSRHSQRPMMKPMKMLNPYAEALRGFYFCLTFCLDLSGLNPWGWIVENSLWWWLCPTCFTLLLYIVL
jgi:hypothetical protein